MHPALNSRGMSLIEVMAAVSILLIAGVGVADMTRSGAKLNADSRHIIRATAIAQDLVAQIQTWDYDDARLDNTDTSNDTTYGDGAFTFEQATGFTADHAEADLTAGGADWNGIDATQLAAGGYERYWNVAEVDDTNGNGTPDCRRIAVIVRWPYGAGFRRVVLYTSKINPAPEERL
jgi:prepilin-type N-terminal cleavage/methylation domain-containing protein